MTKRYNKTETNGIKYREIDLRKTGDSDRKEDRENLFYYFLFNPDTNDFYATRDKNVPEGYVQIMPLRKDGSLGNWRWELNNANNKLKLLIPKYMPVRKVWTVFEKDVLTDDERVMPTSVWYEKQFNSERATEQFLDLGFNKEDFPRPKPTGLISSIIMHTMESDDIILDFYSGSGATAHSLLYINKEDTGARKYILVEMGQSFDTVIKRRIKKVMYSDNWKDGKPQSIEGISHIFKYQYLEQYEDTLNNIEFKDAGSYQRTLSEMEGYFLRYMLDFETRDSSPCRFNIVKLTKPFDYTLKSREETNDDRVKLTKPFDYTLKIGNELKDQKVDLVETFNYLLGIHVRQIRTFKNNGTYYRVVFGRKSEDEIAIIWRDTENLDLRALQADKAFIEGTILSGIKPSKIYINADFYVEGALPIEPEFKKLMVV